LNESIAHVEKRLANLRPELAERFIAAVSDLEAVESISGISAWAGICDQLASSGWHTWDSALAYVDISLELHEKSDLDNLLACGEHAIKLCGISHEPATAYLNGIGKLLALELLDIRDKWQRTGDLINRSHVQPSAPLTEYFRVGSMIAGRYPDGVSTWIDLTDQFAGQDLAWLSAFLNVCKQNTGGMELPWSYGRRLQSVSNQACIEYFTAFAQLRGLVDDNQLRQFQDLLLKMAVDETETTDFLQSAVQVLNQVDSGTTLITSCIPLAEVHPRLVNCLLSSVDRLPLNAPDQLTPWVEAGLAIAKGNLQAGEAFFGLESATSEDLLHALVGQVNFAGNQRLFHLYSEGITGRRFRIEELKESSDSYRELPTSDGNHIYLPAALNEFDEVHRNFLLYKLSLLHQLGFHECGTFDFRFADDSDPFAAFLGQFEDSDLATAIFQLLEDGRIDWYLIRRYRGTAQELGWLMQHVLEHRPALVELQRNGEQVTTLLLEALLQYTLGRTGAESKGLKPNLDVVLDQLLACVVPLSVDGASIYDTMEAVERCYQLISAVELNGMEKDSPPDLLPKAGSKDSNEVPQWVPEPVFYRGRMNPDQIVHALQLATADEVLNDLMDGEQNVALSDLIDQSKVKIEKLAKGDVKDAMGMFLTDLDQQLEDGAIEEDLEEELENLKSMIQSAVASLPQSSQVFFYDEWDYLIDDYRRNWCKLHEIILDSEDQSFVDKTVQEHKGILSQIRRQLQMLKPELQRKVKGLLDGEDIDLDRAVESIVDRKTGHSSNEKIYVQRLKKERDVSALFLLDMSASTDDRIFDPSAVTAVESAAQDAQDEDDFLETFYGSESATRDAPKRRIIDVEKESVVLMAEALEELGDSYAVSGFSGYGRDQVDYYLCKGFNEKYNSDVKGRISAIKPCRSTRMGPAIRHASNQLAKTESRIKALIIISDGYPQDFDYGKERNLREYGIRDTTKALSEARQKGVQTFCLTVDPSGHDYLREMCPDQQYMVIQDITQLPKELSKVYHGLTS
jgi:nitric oxide reductase NorD protein